ncbi:Gfo/Idh/MocA family protein [Fusibacter ferrireducens]|uniref:Gfo/Idh/MocA family oxidoreductase n=1 Tax=Fusibacter ferrireducens TaxID=2785058 RepID=A0ABR9ZPL2_9FIRM|nr:Gfo/Idh/MocA family oxidoreductase [Fusibacter ferrireducens]MBF4692402.1 Gfo/Idh/MocA family oxidoreductase [Fusibacter ferrireducens]
MIRWGLYGIGAIADKFASDFKAVEEGHIVAVYGRRKAAADAFCKTHDILNCYCDEDDFFADQSIDVVYVATPHVLHSEVAMKALNAGKHVLCEKPFSMNETQTKMVLETSQRNQKYVMEALWTLFLPAVEQALAWIKEDKIGRVHLIEGSFGFHGSEDPSGRLMNPDLGGGALLDVGIYPLFMANAIAGGVPEKISAVSKFTKTGVDETTLVTSLYKNGLLAVTKTSIYLELENDLVIYGDKGKIKIPSFWMAQEAFLISADQETHFHKSESLYTGYQYEARAVCKDILQHKLENDRVTHQFTLALTQTLDRVRREIGLKYNKIES